MLCQSFWWGHPHLEKKETTEMTEESRAGWTKGKAAYWHFLVFIHLFSTSVSTCGFTTTHLASAQWEPTEQVRGGAWWRRQVGWGALKDTQVEFMWTEKEGWMQIQTSVVENQRVLKRPGARLRETHRKMILRCIYWNAGTGCFSLLHATERWLCLGFRQSSSSSVFFYLHQEVMFLAVFVCLLTI